MSYMQSSRPQNQSASISSSFSRLQQSTRTPSRPSPLKAGFTVNENFSPTFFGFDNVDIQNLPKADAQLPSWSPENASPALVDDPYDPLGTVLGMFHQEQPTTVALSDVVAVQPTAELIQAPTLSANLAIRARDVQDLVDLYSLPNRLPHAPSTAPTYPAPDHLVGSSDAIVEHMMEQFIVAAPHETPQEQPFLTSPQLTSESPSPDSEHLTTPSPSGLAAFTEPVIEGELPLFEDSASYSHLLETVRSITPSRSKSADIMPPPPVPADAASKAKARTRKVPLLGADAPVQDRKYSSPSATSRRDVPASVKRKLGNITDPHDVQDEVKRKRLQNTQAARRSRARKAQQFQELEEENNKLQDKLDEWQAWSSQVWELSQQGYDYTSFPAQPTP